MSRRREHIQERGNSCFIGNLEFSTTEAQLREIFEKVGVVKSIRLVHDQETKKFKGFAFVEYNDRDTALSAARNLKDIELNGRVIRIEAGDKKGSGKNKASGSKEDGGKAAKPAEETRPDLKTDQDIQKEIAQLMQGLSTSQLYQLLSQMQSLVSADPQAARQLLTANPQFCYAMLHAQFLLGISEEEVLPMTADEVSLAKDRGQKIQAGVAAYVPPGSKQPPPPPPGGASAGYMHGATGVALAMSLPAPESLSTEQMADLVQKLKQIPVPELDKLPHQTKQKVILFLEAYKKRTT